MIPCPTCKTVLPAKALFCTVCGSVQTPAGPQVEVSAPTVRLRPAKTKANRCRSCQAVLPAKALFCTVCGSVQTPVGLGVEVSAPTVRLRPAKTKANRCRTCQAVLPANARFCTVCGSVQTPQASSPPDTQGTPPPHGGDDTSADSLQPATKRASSSQKSSYRSFLPTPASRPSVIPVRPIARRVESSAAHPRRNAVHPEFSSTPTASATLLSSSSTASAPVLPPPPTHPELSRSVNNPPVPSSSAKAEGISDILTQPLGVPSGLVRKSAARSLILAELSTQGTTISTKAEGISDILTQPLGVPSGPVRKSAARSLILAESSTQGTPISTQQTKRLPTTSGDPNPTLSTTVPISDKQLSPMHPGPSYTPPGVGRPGKEKIAELAKRLVFAPHWIPGALTVLLPAIALALWSFSLPSVDIRQMNDLGLVSVFPASIILALLMLNVSFCLTLGQARFRVPVAFLHLALLIFMLYSVTTLVEEAVRFSTVYRHAGYTEYIMRTGSVDQSLDAYFSWPGFFLLSAFVTQAAGYHSILQYAAWAPVFLNVIYFGPLYMIFRTVTSNRRLVWLAIWFFYVTNWVGQDYFSPQGLNFFFYLTIIAVLLKWFQVPATARPPWWTRWIRLPGRLAPFAQKLSEWVMVPEQIQAPIHSWQRGALLVFLVVIFGFVVFSHPLTPFFVLVSVTALIFLRRCNPLWLPVVMGLMTGAWILIMAQPFLVGHSSLVVGAVGQVKTSLSANVSSRVSAGNPQHTLVAEMRVVTAMVLWGLAFLGAIRRQLKGHHDLTYLLLAVVPFPLVAVQDYGGEMFLRIYLFVLPVMVFFVATLFYPPRQQADRRPQILVMGACTALCLLLMAGFLITRYGNEHVDYKSYAEVNGVSYLYRIAPPHSILLQGWEDTPWQFQDFEKYTNESLDSAVPDAVATDNVDAIIQFAQSQKNPTYLVFTRSQIVSSESFSGLPPGTLNRLENSLVDSGHFQLIYSNPDVKILVFEDAAKGAKG